MYPLRITAVLLLLSGFAASAMAADAGGLSSCDKNTDGRLDAGEYQQCLLTLDPTLSVMAADAVSPQEKAKALAIELVEEAFAGADSISLAQAEQEFKQRVNNTRAPVDLKFGWESLRVGRRLTDAVDPRNTRYPAAFILSYTDDREAKKDSFVALGDITWWSHLFGSLTRVAAKSSMDIATSKASSESSIDASVVLAHVWKYESAWLNSLGASLEPKYATDRDFRRDVFQVSAVFAPSSEKILNAGYNTTVGKPSVGYSDNIELYWQPALGFEYGTVNDSGGNAALEAIRASGAFKRVALSAEFKLWKTNFPLSLNAAYTERWDADQHWSRGFFTTGIQYDIAKNFALTLTYRKGRKPDTFEKVEDVLLGIGFTKAE